MTAHENPYRPPPEAADGPAPTEAAGGRAVALYSPGQVVLGTFLGTPLAGSLLMALNARRLGQGRSGTIVALGSLATFLVTVAAFLLPDDIPGIVINIPVLVLMFHVASRLQGTRFLDHVEQGGDKGSSWAAVGIGLACAAVLVVLVFLSLLVKGILVPSPVP